MTVTAPAGFRCTGCGHEVAWDAPAFACPAARPGDDIDHVLARGPGPDATDAPFIVDPDEPNPFLRHRARLHFYQVARAGGLADADYVALVTRLDRAVAAVEDRPRGFTITPLLDRKGLGVLAKDETGNVSGSHKARHLFGVLLHIEVLDAIGRGAGLRDRPFAIASCGNAALGAAVVARAAGRRLRVFIPTDAHPNVVARLTALGADVEVCPRDPAVPGDPTYHRFKQAVAEGALPLSCQGPDAGVTIEGGRTLGWELAEAARDLDHVVVQVGGGALGSAVWQALDEAAQIGVIAKRPRVHFVQTKGCFPLHRAYEALHDDYRSDPPDLAAAVRHRARYMRPWESAPHSVAHGILDDETYDWRALCEAMLRTGGRPVVVDEETLIEANRLANAARPPAAAAIDETGTAGLAGVLALRAGGAIRDGETTAVIFSGARR